MSLELSGTTGVKGVAGSVSAPSIVGDDTNTGISFPAADTIKFSTGGVERMSITNSGVSGITAGITMADQWRLTTSYTANGAAALLANWERVDNTNYAKIGTGMSESSGIFSFPTTGIYYIQFNSRAAANGGARSYAGLYIETGVSGSYTIVAEAYDSASASGYYINLTTSTIFDVTNTSTHTVEFNVDTSGSTVYGGNSNINQTFVTFLRLGDT